MIRTRLGPTSLAVAVACTLATLLAGRAFAQDQAAIDKLVQMNKKALDDYDTLEFDSAKKTLLDALVSGKKAGLDNHPVMARTYVHLGAVYITGFKNRDKAIQSFSRALEIDPSIQLSKAIASAEVADAFNEAKRSKGGGGGEAAPPPAGKKRRGPVMEGSAESPPPRPKKTTLATSADEEDEEKDLPVKIQALDCPNEDEAILEKPAILRCAVAPTLPVAKVFLLYKEPGKEEYTEQQMTKTPKGWYQGKIPKKVVTGKSLPYYFEGRNAAGKTVVANGAKDSPNLLLLMEEQAYKEARKSRPPPGEEEEENPLDRPQGPYHGPRYKIGTQDPNLEGLDVRYGNRKWWIGLGAGSGFGYAKGNGLEAVNASPDPQFHSLSSNFQAGGAWAGLGHLAPEVGLQISPHIAVSLEGRFQYIPQPSQYSKFAARGAISGLLKVMVYTKQAKIRFFGTGIVGGGEGFRFVVKPASIINDPNDPLYKVRDFTDTVKGGPLIAGPGVGAYYEAARNVSIVFEVHELFGFPTFSAVTDAQLALQFNFYKSTEVVTPGRYVPKEDEEEPK